MKSTTESEWHVVCDRLTSGGYDTLSADEKVWINVRSLIDSINNGGLISYFYNSGADHLDDCMSALDLLEAVEIKDRVKVVADLFLSDHSATLVERNEVIDSWRQNGVIDKLLDQVDDELQPLIGPLEHRLEEYVFRFLSKVV